GLLRVNVTHRKLLSVAAVNSLSSTSTTSGKVHNDEAALKVVQKRSISRFTPLSSKTYLGPVTASTPGRHTRGLLKPVGRLISLGTSAGSSRRVGPAAASTTFEPEFSPLPV